MTGHELARALLALPDIEVGDEDGRMVTGVEKSDYFNDTGDHYFAMLYLDRD